MDPNMLSDTEWALQVRMAENMQNLYVRKIGKLFGG